MEHFIEWNIIEWNIVGHVYVRNRLRNSFIESAPEAGGQPADLLDGRVERLAVAGARLPAFVLALQVVADRLLGPML
jgi:hypothetical protein